MIPVNEPLLAGNELQYLTECVTTGWISSAGRFIDEFETRWAAYCGMKHGVSVCNGTVALEMAVGILDLPPGSEIILPSFTIISCAQAITKSRCVPVLVDCDPDTWCMNVDQVSAKITPRSAAVMPVHIYGHPVNWSPLRQLARERGLILIEDAAEVHGAEVLVTDGESSNWRRCGGLGDISCFSFYANKIVTTGEGGMVLVNNDEWAERLRSYRNLCFQPQRRFYHERIGDNYRLTNMQAAVGLAQIEQIDGFIARKRKMARRYNEGLAGLPLQLPVEKAWARNVYWMYGVVLEDDIDMDAAKFAKRLSALGVQTRPFFLGMHEQPVFHRMGLFQGERYPVTERIARRGLYLPSGLALTSDQIDQVIDAVRQVLV